MILAKEGNWKSTEKEKKMACKKRGLAWSKLGGGAEAT
jgi:hypothetical protein